MFLRSILLSALALGWVACSHVQPVAKGAIVVNCKVDSAEVWLNERFLSEVRNMRAGVRVRPGTYRLEVRHQNYYPAYRLVTVTAGQRAVIAVDPAPR